MREEVDTLLKAINLANMDGLMKVEADMADLMLLRAVVRDQQTALTRLNREIYALRVSIELKGLEKPMRLRMYA